MGSPTKLPPVTAAEITEGLLASHQFDFKGAEKCLNDGIQALTKVLARVKNAKWNEVSPEKAAQSASYLEKVLSGIIRDISFAQGGLDSRVEELGAVAMEKALQTLTPEQFATFADWQKANK